MQRNCQLEKCLHRVNMKKNLSGGEMWRKICHVEEFLNMRNMETNLFCQSSCCFVAKSLLLPFTLFCRKIYFFSQFMRFCMEKNLTNNCVCGEKRHISGMAIASEDVRIFTHKITSLRFHLFFLRLSFIPYRFVQHCALVQNHPFDLLLVKEKL